MFMPFVMPQMPLFVALTKGSNDLCCICLCLFQLWQEAWAAQSCLHSSHALGLRDPALQVPGNPTQDQAPQALGLPDQHSPFAEICPWEYPGCISASREHITYDKLTTCFTQWSWSQHNWSASFGSVYLYPNASKWKRVKVRIHFCQFIDDSGVI